jgi:hypothetical protein
MAPADAKTIRTPMMNDLRMDGPKSKRARIQVLAICRRIWLDAPRVLTNQFRKGRMIAVPALCNPRQVFIRIGHAR